MPYFYHLQIVSIATFKRGRILVAEISQNNGIIARFFAKFINVMNLIDQIESEQLRSDLPDFSSGDTIVVKVKVREGERERLQSFEGVVIAKRNRGLGSAFTVRKISYGEGVERVFQTHSATIDSIEVKRRGKVRQAKLYYLRGLTGKSARIKEKLQLKK